jgi:glycosyltransferase involved in cell wall biosynthesis
MTLLLFTPVARTSAIGGVTALVSRALVARGQRVHVIRTESSHLIDFDAHDFNAPVTRWTEQDQVHGLLRDAGGYIYQIGDNFQLHEGALHWMALHPGVVCLHDFFLGHLFYAWAQKHHSQARCMLHQWYGPEAEEAFFSHPDSESFIEFTHGTMPMTEWVCAMADGVITHSLWGCDRVLASCAGPVRVVPLAPDSTIHARADTALTAGGLRILSVGHVNPNKRLPSVIRAIGESPALRSQASLHLVGAIEPAVRQSLEQLASELDVQLHIYGPLDEPALVDALAQCDVVSCLRWPTLEAASASVVKAMLYGKAVLVTNAGFYADLPDNCTIKIDLKHEIPELRAALESLLRDQELAKRLGKRAQQWAEGTFNTEYYAEQLLEFTEEAVRLAPAKRAIERYTKLIRRWSATISAPLDAEALQRLSIFEL